jgi:hypothetical protein
MRAKSIKGKSSEEIQLALKQSMADARPDEPVGQEVGRGFRPTLAIIFISIKQDRKTVCEILHKEGIDVIGATSAGEFTDDQQTEGGIAILLLDISRNNYTILFEDIGQRSLEDVTASLAQKALQKFTKPALILCSTLFSKAGTMTDGDTLVRNIEAAFGSDITMFGGMAGDDITFTGTFVFTHEKETDNGLAVLVLDEEKISLHGVAISGWKPMGVVRTVTKSEGNLLYTIDDHPALEIYMRFLGKDVATAEDQVRFFDSITVHYPFLIERKGLEPKICGPVGYDKEKKALICESNLIPDSRFRFSTPPDFEIIDSVINTAREMKTAARAEADALLIFSCAGRLSTLGPMAQQENEGLADVWKVPMAGFYTYGEFGKGVNGKHEFHSTTNSWVALEEK